LGLRERYAAHAHPDAAYDGKTPLKQQQIVGRNNRAVADVEILSPLDAKTRDVVRTDQK
jgi:hypothetical protein